MGGAPLKGKAKTVVFWVRDKRKPKFQEPVDLALQARVISSIDLEWFTVVLIQFYYD